LVLSSHRLILPPIFDAISLEKAFGSDPSSLGIIVVRDLPPEYQGYREELLKLAYHFGNLDENVRERYTDPDSKYRFVISP
jgi:hypothetical protein